MRESRGQGQRAEPPGMGRAAHHALAGRIAAGREAYERTRHLPRIIAVGPAEIGGVAAPGTGATTSTATSPSARPIRPSGTRRGIARGGPNEKGAAPAGTAPSMSQAVRAQVRRRRCWPRPIFLASAERAAA